MPSNKKSKFKDLPWNVFNQIAKFSDTQSLKNVRLTRSKQVTDPSTLEVRRRHLPKLLELSESEAARLSSMDAVQLDDVMLAALLHAIVSGKMETAEKLLCLNLDLLFMSLPVICLSYPTNAESNSIELTPFQAALRIGHPAMCKMVGEIFERLGKVSPRFQTEMQDQFNELFFPGCEKVFDFRDVVSAISDAQLSDVKAVLDAEITGTEITGTEGVVSLARALSKFQQNFAEKIRQKSVWNVKDLKAAFTATDKKRREWDKEKEKFELFWNQVVAHVYLNMPEHFLRIMQAGVVCEWVGPGELPNLDPIFTWMIETKAEMGGHVLSAETSNSDGDDWRRIVRRIVHMKAPRVIPDKVWHAVDNGRMLPHDKFFELLSPGASYFSDEWEGAFRLAIKRLEYVQNKTIVEMRKKVFGSGAEDAVSAGQVEKNVNTSATLFAQTSAAATSAAAAAAAPSVDSDSSQKKKQCRPNMK